MQNRNRLKNLKDYIIIGLIIWVGIQTCGKNTNTITNKENLIYSDTVVQIGTPVTNEHYYTRIVPERVIEHHYHNEPIDTGAVVTDYFRARYYRDSLVNDTVSYWWAAKVERNTLDTFYLRTSFKPRTRIITNVYEQVRPSVGVMALYAAGTPYIGAFGTYQTKRFTFSLGLSPMNRGAGIVGVGLKIGR